MSEIKLEMKVRLVRYHFSTVWLPTYWCGRTSEERPSARFALLKGSDGFEIEKPSLYYWTQSVKIVLLSLLSLLCGTPSPLLGCFHDRCSIKWMLICQTAHIIPSAWVLPQIVLLSWRMGCFLQPRCMISPLNYSHKIWFLALHSYTMKRELMH